MGAYSEIINAYFLDKANYSVSDLGLAKKILKENMIVFKKPNEDESKALERVRSYVRYRRGHDGEKSRVKVKQEGLVHVKPLLYNYNELKKAQCSGSAKVLILDIETAPIKAFVWGIWNQNISIGQIQADWFCLTWAAKWLFEDKIFSARLTSKESIKQDDKRIINSMWALLNEADIVITHNGEKFDLKKLNQRFLIHKLIPPAPYYSIDTLKHIRKTFGFVSNKLDYVNRVLNLTRKTSNEGFPLWEKCYNGNIKALKEMEEYNMGDVFILEETYLAIRAWIKPHPNMALFILDEQERCPSCGSSDLKEEDKTYNTTVYSYPVIRCNNCGGVGRRRKTLNTLNQSKSVLSSSPR